MGVAVAIAVAVGGTDVSSTEPDSEHATVTEASANIKIMDKSRACFRNIVRKLVNQLSCF